MFAQFFDLLAGHSLLDQRIIVAGGDPLFVQLGQLGQNGLRSAAVGGVLSRYRCLRLRVRAEGLHSFHMLGQNSADVPRFRVSQACQALAHLGGEGVVGVADVQQGDDTHGKEGHHKEDEDQLDAQREIGKHPKGATPLVWFLVG